MKRSQFLTLVLTLSIFFSAIPKRADAGLIVGAVSGDVRNGLGVGTFLGVAIGIGPYMFGGRGEDFWWFSAISIGAGVLLDFESQVKTEDYVTPLSEMLPFIDDREIIETLALLARKKVGDQIQRDKRSKTVRISFSDSEIERIFANALLTDREYERIRTVLQ